MPTVLGGRRAIRREMIGAFGKHFDFYTTHNKSDIFQISIIQDSPESRSNRTLKASSPPCDSSRIRAAAFLGLILVFPVPVVHDRGRRPAAASVIASFGAAGGIVLVFSLVHVRHLHVVFYRVSRWVSSFVPHRAHSSDPWRASCCWRPARAELLAGLRQR